jgi:NCAIR mutase (PurE)-related protein
MDTEDLRLLLECVRVGQLKVDEALKKLKKLPFEDLGFATVDHHRHLRQGFPECIWGRDKTAQQITGIVEKVVEMGLPVIVTRVDKRKAEIVKESLPEIEYHLVPGMLTFSSKDVPASGKGTIMVISAGTSDLPVAEEAVVTARMMGNEVTTLYDVGVAGIHRLLCQFDKLDEARVFIVVAGMEGALPSVVGGLVSRPVIAVPTSVGYGASFGGLSALLGMLNSCATGVVVVNIDNGFGAGCVASLINRL